MADDEATPPPGWLPVKEAAAAVGLHHGTLRSYVRAGKVPGRHLPGPGGQPHLYVPLEAVQARASAARPAALQLPDSGPGLGEAMLRLVEHSEALLQRLDASEQARHRAELTVERQRGKRRAGEGPARKEGASMWEHLSVRHQRDGGASDGRFSEPVSSYLADLGHQGWEMVSTAVLHDGTLLMFFKRPARPDAPTPADPPGELQTGMYL